MQASLLGNRTKGRVVAEVQSEVDVNGQIEHSLELIAPALRYRHGLLTVTHDRDDVYPAEFDSAFMGSRGHWEPDDHSPRPWVGYDQDSFTAALSSVLSNPNVVALINSLIARINDMEPTAA